jgi:hypothetical protein
MRYNRLIVYPGVSMDYLLLLGEKWCIPDSILEMIKERIENNINVNKISNTNVNNINEITKISHKDNIIFKCNNCKAGFKMSENTQGACLSHTFFNTNVNRFICCGGEPNSLPCILGYHVLSEEDLQIYLNLKNE